MTEIERLARVLFEAVYHEERWNTLTPDERWNWTQRVRALLTALREPSEGMIAAAEPFEGADLVDADVPAMWRAMVDVLLSDGGG